MPAQSVPIANTSKLAAPERPTLSVFQQPVYKPQAPSQLSQSSTAIRSPETRTASSAPYPKTSPTQDQSSQARPTNRNAVVDALTMQLLEKLLQECLALSIRNTAAEGLGQAHAEQRAMLDAERNRVVDVCAGNLLENTLGAYSLEVARGIGLECQCNQNRLRRSVNQWKRSLEKVRAAKAAKEKRRRNFQALSSRLGASPHKDAADGSFASVESPNQTFAELLPDPFVEEEEEQSDKTLIPTRSKTVNGVAQRSPFWLRDTLAIFICDLANKAFSTFRTSKPPDWKVLVIVPSLSDSIASWYRCKLGMQTTEDQRIDRMPYVQVEFVLLTEQDLYDEVSHFLHHCIVYTRLTRIVQDLETVGFVITNVDKIDLSVEIREKLRSRLLASSRFCPPSLQVHWSSQISKVSITLTARTGSTQTDAYFLNFLAYLTKVLADRWHLSSRYQ